MKRKISVVILFLMCLCLCSCMMDIDPAQPTISANEGTQTIATIPTDKYSSTEEDTTAEEITIFKESIAETESISDENSTFEIHFLDVGQADAALVLCDEEAMLIDGGNAEDSSLIYSYLKTYGISYLDYIICTHPHEDHVGGLSGALNYATVGVAYCSTDNYDTKTFNNFKKYLGQQGKQIEIPTVGESFSLGSSTVSFLGPVKHYDEPNNMSIVLQIQYGNTSFLFAGDAEIDSEQDILNAETNLKSTLLKVGHHGSSTSTSYRWLREIAPEYAVISVGKDNSYGHPTEQTLSRLQDAEVLLFRTDMQGHIICSSDGTTLSFSVGRNADADTFYIEPPATVPTESTSSDHEHHGTQTSYVLNTNTKKFHYPSCSSVSQMADKNRKDVTAGRDEVIAMGYSPCGRCNP